MDPALAGYNQPFFDTYTDLANAIDSVPSCEWSPLPPATPQRYRSFDALFIFAIRNILNKE